MTWNLFFTPVDMVEPVLTWWTRFWPKTALNSFFTLVDMVWPVLTWWNRFLWKDAIDSSKIFFFLNFKLFLNFFFGFFIKNTRNKIIFKKILVNPKLGYNKIYSFFYFQFMLLMIARANSKLLLWTIYC
jgi:hypothetical protein